MVSAPPGLSINMVTSAKKPSGSYYQGPKTVGDAPEEMPFNLGMNYEFCLESSCLKLSASFWSNEMKNDY